LICFGGFGAKVGGRIDDGGFAVVIFVTERTSVCGFGKVSASFVLVWHVAVVQALTKQGGGGVKKPSAVPVPFMNIVTVSKTVELGGGPLRVMQSLLTGVSGKEGEPEGDSEGLLDPAVLDTFVVANCN
jgi:hypothetical protein